jgi:hypothetical protein
LLLLRNGCGSEFGENISQFVVLAFNLFTQLLQSYFGLGYLFASSLMLKLIALNSITDGCYDLISRRCVIVSEMQLRFFNCGLQGLSLGLE